MNFNPYMSEFLLPELQQIVIRYVGATCRELWSHPCQNLPFSFDDMVYCPSMKMLSCAECVNTNPRDCNGWAQHDERKCAVSLQRDAEQSNGYAIFQNSNIRHHACDRGPRNFCESCFDTCLTCGHYLQVFCDDGGIKPLVLSRKRKRFGDKVVH